ncbi:phosphatidylinositol phosphatase PTPRQ-like [Thrips palmi]|uniref:Phosphatidylinositol phosphatase PTPRQ-like n=1 Tax=Thrips palmi TaxID=161013 RepID=A0A6P8ZH58_THRPL|nr:phosphatidylinositol phosphatase PTPRQ-like [Thrips palmi]
MYQSFCSASPTNRTLLKSIQTNLTCSCAAGFEGIACGKVCSPGRYGANCTEPCGQCSGQKVCDPFTGICPQGCSTGYVPPHCHQPMSHLIGGVNTSAVTDSSFTGHISLDPMLMAGTGSVHFYELHYKEEQKLVWTPGCLGQLNGSETYDCSVDGLRPNTSYHVRVLLLDTKMEGFSNVGHISVRTEGERQLSDVVVSDITATSLRVSWTSPGPPNGEFFVMYQCEALLGCPSESCEHAKGTLIVRSQTVVLFDLVPFASYLIMVSRDGESETIGATTLTKVPDAVVSDLQTALVTNETAVVRWRPPLVCALLNGPANNFRWQLLPAVPLGALTPVPERSGSTNNMVLMLRDLESLKAYELRVSIVNAVGNSNKWATLLFNTTNTVPDAPRELAVYRLNATTLWTHWKVPAIPRGVIRHYVVTVLDARSERKDVVSPTSVCPAWPDLVCHQVGGLKPHTEYNVVVQAVNDLGDGLGAPSAVKRATEIGVPQAPKNLLLLETHPRSLVIQWQLPDFINADLSHFEVLVTPLRDEAGRPRREEIEVTEEKPVYVHTITKLKPNTTYKIAVRCGWNGQEAYLRSTSTAAE